MSKQATRALHPEDAAFALMDKCVKAVALIHKAAGECSHREGTAPDFAWIDSKLAKAISLVASARSIAITSGGLVDPAFDDGDTWDLDDEIALPGDDYTRQVGERGRP